LASVSLAGGRVAQAVRLIVAAAKAATASAKRSGLGVVVEQVIEKSPRPVGLLRMDVLAARRQVPDASCVSTM
jgi:hypothetical protein